MNAITQSLRTMLLLAFRRVVSVYFRSIEVHGEVPDARVGGRLFGANHFNGLVDPILVLTHAPCRMSPIAKSTLFDIPGLRFLLDVAEAVPIRRKKDDPNRDARANDAVFDRVAEHLATGGNILIFPEGVSHNEPHLLPLRSGAAEMLRAAKKKGGSPTYQAVALEFDRRDLFRSRALVLYGPVREMPDVPDEELAKEITSGLARDLSEMLVEGTSWQDHELITRVARLYANMSSDDGALHAHDATSLTSLNSLGRRVELARKMLDASSPELATLGAQVSAYYKHLDSAHLDDSTVAIPTPPSFISAWLWFLALLPWFIAGCVFFAIPWHGIAAISRRTIKEADVASTYKLGLGLAVYPTWCAALALATLAFAPWWAPLVALPTLVLTAFVSLSQLERLDRLRARLRSDMSALPALRTERESLMSALDTARAKLAV